MTQLRAEIEIAATPEVVWEHVADIASHVEWMAEAVAIRFRGEQRSGAGTEIECDTKVGPFTTTDVLRFTEWEPPRVMGIVHEGAVVGSGRFTLEPVPPDNPTRTRFVWEEQLRFPLRMGGAVGAIAGAAVLRRVWARNLHRLKQRVEAAASPPVS